MPRDDDRTRRIDDALELSHESDLEDEQRLYLDDGRRVAVVREAGLQAVEIRAASGQLELRIRLTPEGPVLSIDAARLDLRADRVAVECDTFEVKARESAVVASAGTVAIKAETELDVEAGGDVKVVGKTINLN